MRLRYAAYILLLASLTSAQCQQTAEDWFNKGDLLLNLGEYIEAIEAYNKAIELNQSYVVAWSHKGNALFNLTEYQESLKCYNKAIELDSNYSFAWNNKGTALASLGKYDEAIEAYNESIRLDPTDARVWVSKGIILKNQGRYDEAAMAFEEANRLDPERYESVNATTLESLNSPDWMEVTTYEQGRGMRCYIILYNQGDSMIRSDGNLTIEVFEGDPATKLWSKSYPVRAADFADTILGIFERHAIVWDVGRISYDTIKPGLGDLSLEESVSLEIRAYFETKDGRTLKDKSSEFIS
jgi:tetratricopeptide (TPR) repeat protein